MAKKSMVNRERKRTLLVERYAAKRAAIKVIAADETLPLEERDAARIKLQKLPRDSSHAHG